MRRSILILAAGAMLTVSQLNPAMADSSTEKSNSASINLVSKWTSPLAPISVKPGSDVSLKLNYLYNGSNNYSVKGDVGKKTLTIQNLSPLSLPVVFAGQSVELVVNSDMSAIPTGTKVLKIKGNLITLNNSIKSAITGTIKVFGNGNVDKNAFMQVFLTPCTATNVPAVLIYSYSPTVKSDDEEKSSTNGNSMLTFKWKVSKSQALGCYYAYARFTANPGSQVSMIATPTDLKNPATITVISKGKSKD